MVKSKKGDASAAGRLLSETAGGYTGKDLSPEVVWVSHVGVVLASVEKGTRSVV